MSAEEYARFSFGLNMDRDIEMDCQCGWSMRVETLDMLLVDLIDAADAHDCPARPASTDTQGDA